MEARGTTEKGECRSLACKTMIEPNSWDLNEVKVQPSPPFTPYNFYMKISRLSSLVFILSFHSSIKC